MDLEKCWSLPPGRPFKHTARWLSGSLRTFPPFRGTQATSLRTGCQAADSPLHIILGNLCRERIGGYRNATGRKRESPGAVQGTSLPRGRGEGKSQALSLRTRPEDSPREIHFYPGSWQLCLPFFTQKESRHPFFCPQMPPRQPVPLRADRSHYNPNIIRSPEPCCRSCSRARLRPSAFTWRSPFRYASYIEEYTHTPPKKKKPPTKSFESTVSHFLQRCYRFLTLMLAQVPACLRAVTVIDQGKVFLALNYLAINN